MDLQAILKAFDNQNINKVKLGTFDLDGVFRGKYVSLDKFIGAAVSGLSFCDVIYGWDVNDELYDRESLTGWHTGYPDAKVRIDLDTFRAIPWEPETALFIMDLYEPDEAPHPLSPRHLLKTLLDRAQGLGYTVKCAAEYEFFFFEETSHSLQEKGFTDLKPLTPGMFGYSIIRASSRAELIHNIIDAMRDYGIELEGIHTETGPGVYETAIHSEFGIAAADKAALFKSAIKEIAARHGLTATFMAKWNADLPGCSGHIHQSLWKEDHNSFSDSESPDKLSDTARQYIAGNLAMMADLTALSCPTINSYKRAVPGVWSPVNASWGLENRTTAIRAVPGNFAKSARVESRLSGADANPYLAMAASLAAGLYGIENELEPPSPVAGNAYEDGSLALLPTNLAAATKLLNHSEMARKYLGDTFVNHFVMTREHEVRLYEKAVTDWELKRYFEII